MANREIADLNLRDYQINASISIGYGIKMGEDSLAVLPTGAGKTAVIADICRSVTQGFVTTKTGGKRVLVLSHVKEIVQQTYDFLDKFMWQNFKSGVYSAGLKRRDKGEEFQVLVAGIQSVYNKTKIIGKFDVIIIDEVHLLPPKGEGRYRTLVKEQRDINPYCTVVGLTATPYRMGGGYIYGENRLFKKICYEIKVSDLIKKGWLTRVTNKLGATKQDFDSIPLKNGEFDAKEVETRCYLQYHEVVEDFLERTKDRKAVLVFAPSVNNSILMGVELREKGCSWKSIYGDTPQQERDKTIQEFKEGKIKYLLNVGVLTTGFDAPNVDCIVLARPTASPGLYVQMVGRGLRLCEGKENCLILDYGGNIGRHGPIDDIYMRKRGKRVNFKKDRPKLKLCRHCQTYNSIFAKVCSECGNDFGPDRSKLTIPELKKAILFNEKPFNVAVQKVQFKRHISQKGNECLKVVYFCGDTFFQQFFFVDPKSFFYPRFVAFWTYLWKDGYWEEGEDEIDEDVIQKTNPPKSLNEALERIRRGELGDCREIRVSYERGSKFPKIDGWKHVWRDEATGEVFNEDTDNLNEETTDELFGWNIRENPYWNEKRDGPTTPSGQWKEYVHKKYGNQKTEPNEGDLLEEQED